MVHNIANVLNVTELYVHSEVVKMLNFMLCVFNHTHTHKAGRVSTLVSGRRCCAEGSRPGLAGGAHRQQRWDLHR